MRNGFRPSRILEYGVQVSGTNVDSFKLLLKEVPFLPSNFRRVNFKYPQTVQRIPSDWSNLQANRRGRGLSESTHIVLVLIEWVYDFGVWFDGFRGTPKGKPMPFLAGPPPKKQNKTRHTQTASCRVCILRLQDHFHFSALHGNRSFKYRQELRSGDSGP